MSFYFDYNATSPLRECVKEAINEAMLYFGNASSVHHKGRSIRAMIDKCREMIADYFGVLPLNIIFTSSATEANHTFIRGIECDVIISSKAEHDSVKNAIELSGKPCFWVKHTQDGDLDRNSFDRIIETIKQDYKKPLLTLMKVNNETGIISDLEYFASVIRGLGGVVHSDAVQAFGKISCDSWGWQCDALTVSAHKVGGPSGIGFLIVRDQINMTPFMGGGGQEMRRRAGTENFIFIHALNALIHEIKNNSDELNHILYMRQKLEEDIKKINPNVMIIGENSKRVPNTICLVSEGIESEKQVIIADLDKVCVSAGSACSSGKVKKSEVLSNYGFSDKQSGSSLRISLGFNTTAEDCEAFLKAYQKIVARIS